MQFSFTGYDELMYSWSALEKICFCQSIPMTSILIIIFILPGVSAAMTSNTEHEDRYRVCCRSYFKKLPYGAMKDAVNIVHDSYTIEVVCKGDHYFDPNTSNCDPCAPLCAVTNCSRICPNYHMPRASSIVQTSLSDNSSTFRTEYLVIVIAAIAFALALFGYTLYKRHQKKRSEIPVTTVAVQIDDPDTENEERVTINTNTEHFSSF